MKKITIILIILFCSNANAENPSAELAKLFLQTHDYSARYISGVLNQMEAQHSVFKVGEYDALLGRVATSEDVVKSKNLIRRISSKHFNEIDIQKNTELVYLSIFTESEIVKVLKFYKTDLGKKLLLSQSSVGKILAKKNAESFRESNSAFLDDFSSEFTKMFPPAHK